MADPDDTDSTSPAISVSPRVERSAAPTLDVENVPARSARPDPDEMPPWVTKLGWRVAMVVGTSFGGAIALSAYLSSKYTSELGDIKLAMAKDSAAAAVSLQNVERRLDKLETKLDHWWKPGAGSSDSPPDAGGEAAPDALAAPSTASSLSKWTLMTNCDPSTVKVFSAFDLDAGAATCRTEGARLLREYGEGNEYLYKLAKAEIADGGVGRVLRWTVSSSPKVECECRLKLAEY